MIVFDTYAWVEYFIGSKKGEIVKSYLENDQVITPTLAILELSAKSEKEGLEINKFINFIKANSIIINLNEEIIIKAGKLYNKIRKGIKDFGLIDATILTTAIISKSKLLTGDTHFKNLQNVDFLE